MYNSISMPEFEQQWKKDTLPLVDVRETNEWKNGHLEGAVHVPLSELSSAKQKLDKNQKYYVMCHSGSRSSMACQQLAKEGYKVTNVMGGISAWRGEIV
ncbi:rhodanese-like domain-containing protein [Desemzia sp. RIT804]|uniref:rhodanese-like domain-containing protein n=1 Tax=Desemzia sp. RIT 804 TaxID=2810209 RepID=UPI0019502265|nr:rhodanese-like domain-containing protein [Desemzia sp. RIT 804]MBM6614289.1 rhodanese-like domain-containing protein [Desemzia sp. RIT 804]